MLPRLDLTVQGSGVGLGGNQVPVTRTSGHHDARRFGRSGNTLGQVFGFNSPTYGAGMQLTLPFRSTAARAQLSDALVSRTRDHYNERLIQQQIIQDVRLTLNSIDLANATIEAATLARDLAKKNVEAEQQKYELGTITAFEVLDSQTRLSSVGELAAECLRGLSAGLISVISVPPGRCWRVGDGSGDAAGPVALSAPFAKLKFHLMAKLSIKDLYLTRQACLHSRRFQCSAGERRAGDHQR